MTDDRRGAFRKNAFTFGALQSADGEIACLVWDATETGAQIAEEESQGVPDRFALRLAEGTEPRPVVVAWRSSRRIGVAFEG